VVGIDTVRIVIPRLKVPLIFKSRPHAPQPGQGRARGDDERPRLYGGPMASVKQIQVTFDCAEPERVARFWCEVLGLRRTAATGGVCYLGRFRSRAAA
jgi:hypothetical protein